MHKNSRFKQIIFSKYAILWECSKLVTWYRQRHVTTILHYHWQEFWWRNTDLLITLSIMSIRFLWDFFVFRLVAYLLNMICLNLLFLYQNCIYIYEFSYKFDKVFYQYLETWTSDITFMGRDQEPKWLLAFSIYPLSFFLYGPLKIKGEDKGAQGKDRCMIRTSSSITWNIFS